MLLLSTGYSLRGPHGPDASKRPLRCDSHMMGILEEIKKQISCLRHEVSDLRESYFCPSAMMPIGICRTEQAASVNEFIRSVLTDVVPTPEVSRSAVQPMSYDIGTPLTVEDNECEQVIDENAALSGDEYVKHICASDGLPDDAPVDDMPFCKANLADGVQVVVVDTLVQDESHIRKSSVSDIPTDDTQECKITFLEDKTEVLRCELDVALAMQWRRGLGLVTEASNVAFSLSIQQELKAEAAVCIQTWWRSIFGCIAKDKEPIRDENVAEDTSLTLGYSLPCGRAENYTNEVQVALPSVPAFPSAMTEGADDQVATLLAELAPLANGASHFEHNEMIATLIKDSPNDLLGIKVAKVAAELHSLLVGDVDDGLVMEWNKRNPLTQLSSKCRIVAVNGVRGDTQQMHKLLADELVLSIHFNPPAICQYWRRGICRFGSFCRFSHNVSIPAVHAAVPTFPAALTAATFEQSDNLAA